MNIFEDEPQNVQQIQQHKRFKLTQFAEDFEKPVAAHLIKNVLPQNGLGLLIGKEKSGKSFVSLELAFAIAVGKTEWHGRKIAKAAQGKPVIYISGEGAAGFAQRKKALALKFDLTKEQLKAVPFFDIQTAPNLTDKGVLVDLIHDLGLNGKPVLVVIDTLARTIFGDENDSTVMSAYVDSCSAIQSYLKCTVLVVHHIPKTASMPGMITARGSSVLPASVDVCLKIEILPDDVKKKEISVFFAKDIPADQLFFFKLASMDVGTDDEGDTVTSCALEEVFNDTGTRESDYRRASGAATQKNTIMTRSGHEIAENW